jgi:hypothetical protein
MALLLDLAKLSYRGLMRRPAISLCLLLSVTLSCVGATLLTDGIHAVARLSTPNTDPQDDAGFLRLGRAWPGIAEPEMVSTGRLSPLIEMLRHLGCSVSPVFIYGEDEEKHVLHGMSDYYIRSGLLGVGSDYARIMGSVLQVVDGRFFDEGEVDSSIRVAVLGVSLVSLMRESQDSALPWQILIEGIGYEVIGVVAEGPGQRSRHDEMSVAGRIILPYTTLAEHAALMRRGRPALSAVAYRRPGSITDEFVDRVINDWLRENDLLEGRFVSHVTSLALTGPEDAAGRQGSSLSVAVYMWIILFAIVSGAVLGYIRMADRVGELELLRTVGASPLHLTFHIALESLSLAFLGSAIGAVASTLMVRPLVMSVAGLDYPPEGGLRLRFLIMALTFVSSTAGSVRSAKSRRIL